MTLIFKDILQYMNYDNCTHEWIKSTRPILVEEAVIDLEDNLCKKCSVYESTIND